MLLRLTLVSLTFTAVVGSQQNLNLKLSPFGTSNIICHVTIGFVIYGFLYVVNLNQLPTLHACQDMVLERFGVTMLTFWGRVTLAMSRHLQGVVSI